MPACVHCGHAIEPGAKIYRGDTCPGCGRALHSCRNCEFHDPAVHNQCREPAAEWVADRESANFCEFFRISPKGRGPAGRDRAAEAKRKLEDLFRKTPPPDDVED
jgi:hypothetical protein